MRNRTKHGFTMGEMIIAMTITVFVGTAAVGGIAMVLRMRESLELTNAAQALEQATVYTISEGLNNTTGVSKKDASGNVYYCDATTGSYITYKDGTDGIVLATYGKTNTTELFENYYENLGIRSTITGLNNGLNADTKMLEFTVSIVDENDNVIVSNVIKIHPDHIS